MNSPVRVLVVDDSAVFRSVLTDTLGEIPGIQQVGVARDGVDALERVAELRPDLVFMDVMMPRMSGLEALDRLRVSHPDVTVVLVSGVDPATMDATMEAVRAHAFDFVPKASPGDDARGVFRSRIRQVVSAYRQRTRPGVTAPVPAASTPSSGKLPPAVVSAIGIGVSTGGPQALARLLPSLDPNLGVPIFLVQHLPEGFTRSFVNSLQRNCPVPIRIAEDGQTPVGGQVHVAPGGTHMVVAGTRQEPLVRLVDSPPENYCRPAVDVLFRSLPGVYGSATLAVILTGMGSDGLEGVRAVRAGGGYCVAQDAATSVVYGMPKAVADAGETDEVLPLERIAARLGQLVRRRRAG